MRKKILYVLFNTKPCGGNQVVFEHANRLIAKGHVVEIAVLYGGKPSWFALQVPCRNIVQSFLLFKPDIVVATFWITAYICLLFPAKKYYFLQALEETFYTHWFFKLLVRLTYRLPYRKIAVSHYIKDYLSHYDAEHITIIPSIGIETNVSHLKRKRPHTKTILSVVSWYKPYKGLDTLVNVVENVKKRYKEYSFTLISFESKPYKEHVFDQFISNPSKVVLQKLYQDADILLNTSSSEGFLIPGLEAMANGSLLITTNSGGINEYANTKNAIILSKVEDLWEKNILRNIETHTKYRQTIIREGMKTAQKYNWKDIINLLSYTYMKLK